MILQVDRAGDPRLAPYRHVGDHEWLRARGLFVAEGRLIVQRTMDVPGLRIESVLVTPAAFTALESLFRTLAAPVYVVPQGALDEVTGFKFHRGCLALVERPALRGLGAVEHTRLLIGLEGIGNPDNIGGLFRTAAAFGAGGILLDRTSADPFYRKALRTSMGAVLTLPFAQVDAWPAAASRLRGRGFTIVALTPDPASDPLDRFAAGTPPDARLLLLVGSEGAGLSRTTMDAADRRVRIPIASGVDSLNVVVAAGVALSRFGALLS